VARQEVQVVRNTIAANITFELGESVSQTAIHRVATAACTPDFMRPNLMATTPSLASRFTGSESAALWHRQQARPQATTAPNTSP